ncbi:hypothetical protein PHK61_28830 [Actinomycetospora lutea]|uniref:hypothetical protein n=1 Tax=Actinomycetospora lutea TaxID=663604 RepID=UPI002366B5F2|nr:hypothetical protein [Actinomycetospora lutea]MDD7942427.1 hypothetical protein [Actinomycetospora lutea]
MSATSWEPVAGALTTASAVRTSPAEGVRSGKRSTRPVTVSITVSVNRAWPTTSIRSISMKSPLPDDPELSAVTVTDAASAPICFSDAFAGFEPFAGTRTTCASPPPLAKKCRTEYDSELFAWRPPNCRSKSA